MHNRVGPFLPASGPTRLSLLAAGLSLGEPLARARSPLARAFRKKNSISVTAMPSIGALLLTGFQPLGTVHPRSRALALRGRWPVPKIALEVGVDKSTIYKWFRAFGPISGCA